MTLTFSTLNLKRLSHLVKTLQDETVQRQNNLIQNLKGKKGKIELYYILLPPENNFIHYESSASF